MAWTAPATQSTGDLITATLYNNFINNISYLGALVSNGSALSGLGASAEILFNSAVKVTDASNQTISTSTWTAVNFDQEFYDTDTMHDTVTNNDRLTATTAGKYIVWGNVQWDGNATGRRNVRIRNAGDSKNIGLVEVAAPDANDFNMQCVAQLDLDAADYLKLQVWQDSGGNLDIVNTASPDDYSVVFGMMLVNV